MNSSRRRNLWLLCLPLAVALLAYVVVGADSRDGLGEYVRALFTGFADTDGPGWILWQIRMPRAVAAVGVGAVLGAVGATYQALFRNPIAEPFVLGVSGGAAAGGSLAMAAGIAGYAFGFAGVGCAVLGAGIAMLMVLRLAGWGSMASVGRLLVAGVLVGTFFGSMTTLVVILSGEDTNRVLRWLMGSLTPMFWPWAIILLVTAIACVGFLVSQCRSLDALAISESAAKSAGVDVRKVVNWNLAVTSCAVAVTVGTVGIIGFVGLLAPHLARRVFGVRAYQMLPASALIGATLLLVSDLIAQRLVHSIEMPVGAVTAVLGSVLLVAILRPPKV